MSTTTQHRPTAGIVATIDGYLSGWNETDPSERTKIIQRHWDAAGLLVDPPLEGRGHAGIGAMTQALHDHYPDHRFVRAGEIDAHHDAFRFRWRLVGPDGGAALTGVDYGLLGRHGRILRITGFFDGPASAAGDR